MFKNRKTNRLFIYPCLGQDLNVPYCQSSVLSLPNFFVMVLPTYFDKKKIKSINPYSVPMNLPEHVVKLKNKTLQVSLDVFVFLSVA